MEGLTLHRTSAFSHFKRSTGQANHFLVTILVGLDAVERGDAVRQPSFSTTWNPTDLISTARRSREYALHGALVWLADGLESYSRSAPAERGAPLPPSIWIKTEADGTTSPRSLSDGLRQLGVHFQIDPVVRALVDVLATWRNRIVHQNSQATVDGASKGVLRGKAERVRAEFQGLDSIEMLSRLDANRSPTPSFKETASLINAAHMFVRHMDAGLISSLDMDEQLDRVLSDYLGPNSSVARVRSGRIWGTGGPERICKSITQISKQFGFVESLDAERVVSPNHLAEIGALVPSSAFERFFTGIAEVATTR